MSLLQRVLHMFLIVSPSVLVGGALGWWGGRRICPGDDFVCKAQTVTVLLVAVGLLGWSLLLASAFLLEREGDGRLTPLQRLRVNLFDVTPNVVIHAAVFGVLLYPAIEVCRSLLALLPEGEEDLAGVAFTCALLPPVYALTWILRRKRPEAAAAGSLAGWLFLAKIVLQTLAGYALWSGLAVLLVKGVHGVAGPSGGSLWLFGAAAALVAGESFVFVGVLTVIERRQRRHEAAQVERRRARL
jgi:hypothetical protein